MTQSSLVPDSLRIEAGVIVVSSRLVHAPGQVEFRHGVITDVTGRCNRTPHVRLPDWVLLPGLINAHTHLEFSNLLAPLPPGDHFADWIRSVLKLRAESANDTDSANSLHTALARGLMESAQTGVCALADIVSWPWRPGLLRAESLQLSPPAGVDIPESILFAFRQHAYAGAALPGVVACMEQLGISTTRRSQVIAWRDSCLAQAASYWPLRLLELGFSPHAPYSTPDELVQASCMAAQTNHSLVAMHLAESPAERQWLDEGRGPMAELLQELGAEQSAWAARSIESILKVLSQAPRCLVIHGNYLTKSELDILAQYRDRMSVVYCPRTHAHFGHTAYPLDDLLGRGIRVVLGTDSRSTNPDLNLWAEAATALERHSQLRPSAALAAITDSAASALGIGDRWGSIEAGRIAAFNLAPRPQRALPSHAEPFLESLFQDVRHPRPLW